MANDSILEIDCISRKGKTRQSNKDFISIFEFNEGVLVSLVDISTSSQVNSIAFVDSVNGMVCKKINQITLNENSLFNSTFKQIVCELKQEFKIGSASLINTFIPFQATKIWGNTIGDARLGKIGAGEIDWLTPVHTGANPFGENFVDEMKDLPERHLLTRSLNMRREYKPDYFEVNVSDNVPLIIASDGFWAELTIEQQSAILAHQMTSTDDDCSTIKISNLSNSKGFKYTMNSPNCSYFNLTTRA
jgi:serine/threonine protein phosphatase PrpC